MKTKSSHRQEPWWRWAVRVTSTLWVYNLSTNDDECLPCIFYCQGLLVGNVPVVIALPYQRDLAQITSVITVL